MNGFDNVGLMIGTSSCDFNPLNITNSTQWTSPQELGGLVQAINSTFGALQPTQELDVTSVPNPFYGLKMGSYQDANETALSLFDGGLDNENNPLFPLLVKGRKVDIMVALDSVSLTLLDDRRRQAEQLSRAERQATSSQTGSHSSLRRRKSACSLLGS